MKISSLFFCAILALSSCGTEGESNNGTSNNGTNNNTTNTTQTTQTTTLKGSTLLVDKMSFDKAPEAGLNPLIIQNLDQERLEFPIVILLDFMNVDRDAGTMILRGGAGLKTANAGEYTWDPDGDEKTDRGAGTIDKDGNFTATIELFEFIATSKFETEIIKNTIPIRELKISGVLAAEGDVPKSIEDSVIEGYITKVDGDNTRLSLTPGTEGIPLTRIFKDENLNFVTATKTMVEKGDATADAWFLVGKISGQNTTVVE